MYKKILCFGAIVFGLIGVAFADDFDNNEVASGVTTNEYNPGIYFGGQVGTTNMHYKGSEYTSSNSHYDDKYSFAGRGYLGYAFSQFIQTELGYDYYGRPKFIDTNGNTQDILQQGMDLMVKANLPLDYGFGIYIKGGLAWVHRSALHSNNGSFAEKKADDKFPPIGAVGINYWFAPHMALDLCYTKTMTIGDLPTTDLFTAGFIYKINI